MKIDAHREIEAAEYFLKEESYSGNHAFFYNSIHFPEIQVLEKNWQIIAQEVLGIVTDQELSQIKNLNPPYLSNPNGWKNIYFYNFGWRKHKNCARFPQTHSLLMQVPNLVFAGITVLEPKSRVLPHNGETNTTIRCHLGLKIPASLPVCGVRVGSEEESWEEGKIMMFSDAHYHSTWNESDERRFVLVFDIVRPEYAHNKKWVCAQCLGALSLKYLYAKQAKLKELPYPVLTVLHNFFSAMWFLYLPFQHKFSLP